MPRFTISKHVQADSSHYDLMLEEGRILKTWQIASVDFSSPQIVRQSPDHRRVYLDYQGQISGGRGWVEIFDTGTYQVEGLKDDLIIFILNGKKLQVRLSLRLQSDRPGEGSEWQLGPEPSSV
jgi:hypothetical protein